MSDITPPSKPKQSREESLSMLVQAGIPLSTVKVALIGVRGYYRDTMGKPGTNDRGIYDDAIFLVSEHVFAAFNANVDPSVFRKHIATLKPGVWWYKPGIHGLSRPKAKQYQAYVQAAPVRVARDQEGDDTGFFGINIHRGGVNTTSSEGCQTITQDQWIGFRSLLNTELKRAGVEKFPYLLTVAK
jgi:hypothetical protein